MNLRVARLLGIIVVLVGLHAPPVAAAPFAYITNLNSNDVSVIDTAANAVVATIGVGVHPGGLAVNSTGSRVYVANDDGVGTVSVIDTSSNTVVATVLIGGQPYGT